MSDDFGIGELLKSMQGAMGAASNSMTKIKESIDDKHNAEAIKHVNHIQHLKSQGRDFEAEKYLEKLNRQAQEEMAKHAKK